MIHHYHDTTQADGLLWVLGSLWVWKQVYDDLHLLFFVCSFVSGFVLNFFDSLKEQGHRQEVSKKKKKIINR